jgi:hypothetical protein
MYSLNQNKCNPEEEILLCTNEGKPDEYCECQKVYLAEFPGQAVLIVLAAILVGVFSYDCALSSVLFGRRN